MAHDHHHGDRNAFYVEQLFTIGVCGAFAGVTLVLWYSDTLKFMLAEKFHIWVLLGGATLLGMAVVNAVAVWFSVGDAKALPVNGHSHDHDHGHDHAHCDHDHDHGHVHAHAHPHVHEHAPATTAVQAAAGETFVAAAVPAQAAPTAAPAPATATNNGHDHGHGHDGHDHGWAPWRYAVLLLPVAIYFVVPLEALSPAGAKTIDVEAPTRNVADRGEDLNITFLQLEMAALYSENQSFYEGKTVRLRGRYVGDSDDQFTLIRYKINCCIADAIPLNAVIMLDPKAEAQEKLDPGKLRNRFVQVTGRVQFVKRKDSDAYATVLIVSPTKEKPLDELVKEAPPDPNPYAN